MKKYGTRQEVWDGVAQMTKGKLTKDDLTMNASGKVISKKMSQRSFAPKVAGKLGSKETKHAHPKKCTCGVQPLKHSDEKLNLSL